MKKVQKKNSYIIIFLFLGIFSCKTHNSKKITNDPGSDSLIRNSESIENLKDFEPNPRTPQVIVIKPQEEANPDSKDSRKTDDKNNDSSAIIKPDIKTETPNLKETILEEHSLTEDDSSSKPILSEKESEKEKSRTDEELAIITGSTIGATTIAAILAAIVYKKSPIKASKIKKNDLNRKHLSSFRPFPLKPNPLKQNINTAPSRSYLPPPISTDLSSHVEFKKLEEVYLPPNQSATFIIQDTIVKIDLELKFPEHIITVRGNLVELQPKKVQTLEEIKEHVSRSGKKIKGAIDSLTPKSFEQILQIRSHGESITLNIRDDLNIKATYIGSGTFADVYEFRFFNPNDKNNPGLRVATRISKGAYTDIKDPLVDAEEADTLAEDLIESDHFLLSYGYTTYETGSTKKILSFQEIGLSHPENSDFKNLGNQFFDAVNYLHQKDMVHGDLKLANSVMGLDGKLKIIDLDGISDAKKNKGVPIISSPSYQPPEARQAEWGGQGIAYDKSQGCYRLGALCDEWDPRQMDIYAVGMILFQKRLNHPDLNKLLISEPEKLEVFLTDNKLNPKEQTFFRKILHPNFKQRFQTIEEAGEAFKNLEQASVL